MATRRAPKGRSEKYSDPLYLELLERLAENVKRLRERQGLTQEAVAERAGDMDARVVQLVESQRTNPTFATLARLARALGVDPSDLVRRPRRTPSTAKPTKG